MKQTKRERLEHFPIAGFTYYEGCIALKSMQIGDRLKLKVETSNKFDRNAIEIYYKNLKLGYVPRDKNRTIAKILAFGIDIFEARVQRISPEAHTEDQVQAVIYLIKKVNK